MVICSCAAVQSLFKPLLVGGVGTDGRQSRHHPVLGKVVCRSLLVDHRGAHVCVAIATYGHAANEVWSDDPWVFVGSLVALSPRAVGLSFRLLVEHVLDVTPELPTAFAFSRAVVNAEHVQVTPVRLQVNNVKARLDGPSQLVLTVGLQLVRLNPRAVVVQGNMPSHLTASHEAVAVVINCEASREQLVVVVSRHVDALHDTAVAVQLDDLSAIRQSPVRIERVSAQIDAVGVPASQVLTVKPDRSLVLRGGQHRPAVRVDLALHANQRADLAEPVGRRITGHQLDA